jgi:hypothetical protein
MEYEHENNDFWVKIDPKIIILVFVFVNLISKIYTYISLDFSLKKLRFTISRAYEFTGLQNPIVKTSNISDKV